METDLIPVGTTVHVSSHLVEDHFVCQVTNIRVDEKTGEVLYKLGYFTSRRGIFHWIPKSAS